MGLDLKDIVWVSKAPSFENSGLGRALTSEEYLNRYKDEAGNFVPMTSDNMNNAEEMALNLFGADDAVIRIVSGNDGPTDDPKNGVRNPTQLVRSSGSESRSWSSEKKMADWIKTRSTTWPFIVQ